MSLLLFSGTSFDFEVSMSGGVVMGGAAAVSKSASFTMSGGVTMGGTATMTFVRGSRGGGPKLTFVMTMSGGVILGGSATREIRKDEVMSGGVTLGGAALVSAEAPPPLVVQFTMSGGVILDGSATVSGQFSFDYTMSGGVTFSGSSSFAFRRAATPVVPTGPKLATVYIHSPWYPRHRLACLTTAHDIDRSFTAVSRLGTKDTGQGACRISNQDPALLSDPKVLEHGNLMVITSPISAPWVGVLLSTEESDDGSIELSAISYEAVLDARVTPQGLKYTSTVGANAVFNTLLEEANARNHLGLMTPAIVELTNPIEDLEVGGQSVLEALNELAGRTNVEWWLDYEVSPQFIKSTVRLGFAQGYDLSAQRHFYQGTHFTASYRQDMSQVKSAVTAIGDFGADLPDRNSVTQVAAFGPQHLGVQAAAIRQADAAAAQRIATLPAGLRNEKVTFEVMTGSTSELSRRSGLVQERPLSAERMFNVQFYSNVNWKDVQAGNFVTLWGTWFGQTGAHVVRVMGCQPQEESGVLQAVCWEPVL